MAGKTADQFKPGDLVFAKMKGFAHWPARVSKRVPVYFFGTHQMYVLPCPAQQRHNIVPYAGNKMKYGSGVRIRGFAEGMWEIQNTPGMDSKLKVRSLKAAPKLQLPNRLRDQEPTRRKLLLLLLLLLLLPPPLPPLLPPPLQVECQPAAEAQI
uniref:PWWP domain-containing protein n=1 Tax=Kryptolebias marmoratus TaxID=37003 RepID=A0A3Q3FG19_KRYMA